MSLIDFFRGQRTNTEKPENIPIAQSGDGETLYTDEIVSQITSELERRRAERAAYELQWTLNSNFLSGYQNCDIDILSNTITSETDIERGDREKRSYNRIAPLMETRDANLGSVKYDMVVTPRTSEPDDVAKAVVSTKLLKYLQSNVEFDRKQTQLRRWTEVCGTGFSLSWWDKNAGKKVGVEIITTEITDDVGNIAESQEAKDIFEGDLAMGILTAYEVFPHSLVVEDIADQHDIIVEQVLDVQDVMDRYGISVDGESIEAYTMSPLPNASTGHGRNNTTFGINKTTREDCVRVITYFENPSKKHENGRLIIIVKDTIVYYGQLPGGVMPIVAYKAKHVSGMFYGKSVIEDLIPLQRTYNNVMNKLVDNIATVANNPILTPVGSINIDEIEQNGGIQSGSIVEYNPAHGKPEFMQYPNPPSVIFDARAHLEDSMDYTAGVSPLMVYGAANASASGEALKTRREIDMTRMSMTADNLREGVISTAKIWLMLSKAFSTGHRIINIVGNNEVQSVYTWSTEDINSYDVCFSAENELRHSQETQKQNFVEAMQLGLFTDENGRIPQSVKRKAWELFRIGEFEDIMDIDDLQGKNADRENVYLESGVIPKRYKYDNDEIHINKHIAYALSADYRELIRRMPEYAQLFDAHIEEHKAVLKQKAESEQAAAMRAVALSQSNKKGV